MNDQEKSVLLVQVIGWEVSGGVTDDQQPQFSVFGKGLWYSYELPGYTTNPPTFESDFNLYTAPLALTWLVLNWASGRHDGIDDYSYPYTLRQSVESLFNTDYEIKEQLWAKDPADAQRILLDTIFEADVAAGLIKIGEDEG